MKEQGCPRCAGLIIHAQLEGKDEHRWLVLDASRCINCGWYGGEPVMDAHRPRADQLDWLIARVPA